MANEDNADQNALATTPDAADQGGNPGEDQAVEQATEPVADETVTETASELTETAEAAPAEETQTESAPAPTYEAAPQRINQTELSDSLSSYGNVSDEPRKEVEDGRSYEIIFIVRPNQGDSVEDITGSVRSQIEGAEGAVDNIRVSESRRLAYPINKEVEGIYIVVNARFSKDLTLELDRYFKLEENVIRHMVLREDA